MQLQRREFLTRAAATAAAGLALGRLGAQAPLTVAAAGDCLLTRRIRTVGEPEFRAITRVFQEADVGFGNCEMTFHDFEGYPAPTGACGDLNLVAEPAIASELTWAGFNLMTVANNHTLDYGHQGLLATLSHLERAGVTAAGAGEDLARARAPRVRSTTHGRVALVGCASSFRPGSEASPGHAEIRGRPGLSPLHVRTVYGVPPERLAALRETQALLDGAAGRPPQGTESSELRFLGSTFREAVEPSTTTEADPADVEAIVSEVRRARSEADLVLVTIHAHEASRTREQPASFLQPFARACIDAGAHVFLGHGPHVLRGIEVYRGAPIFYSLGNFYFQAESIRQIPQEIYRNCEIASLSPSDFFKKVMGRMFEQDVFWEAIVPRMSFQGGRLLELTLYPVDLSRQRPATERGTPALARAARATEILRRQAELAAAYGTEIQIVDGLGKIRLQ